MLTEQEKQNFHRIRFHSSFVSSLSILRVRVLLCPTIDIHHPMLRNRSLKENESMRNSEEPLVPQDYGSIPTPSTEAEDEDVEDPVQRTLEERLSHMSTGSERWGGSSRGSFIDHSVDLGFEGTGKSFIIIWM